MNSPCIHRTQRGSRYDPLGPGRLELPLLLLLLLLSVIWSIHNHSAPLRNCVVYGLIVGLYQLTSQFKFPIPPCLPSFLAFQSFSNSDWRLFLDSYYWCFVISCSSEPYSKSSWSFFLESTFSFISYHPSHVSWWGKAGAGHGCWSSGRWKGWRQLL